MAVFVFLSFRHARCSVGANLVHYPAVMLGPAYVIVTVVQLEEVDMETWLIENVVWLTAGVVVLLLGIKVALARLFQRLAADSEAAEAKSG